MFRPRKKPRVRYSVEKDAGGLTVAFTGDTSLGDWYLQRAAPETAERLRKDPYSFFHAVAPLVAGKDLLITNLETVLAEDPQSPLAGIKNYLGWDSPKRTVEMLRKLGVDAASLANNHTMDFGQDVLAATASALENADIAYFGAGRDLSTAATPNSWTIKVAGQEKRIHLLGGLKYSTTLRDYGFYASDSGWGTNPLSASSIRGQLENLRRNDPDSLIILYPHWGMNYQWATENMWRRSEEFLQAGADLIIGHGAHMMQEIAALDTGTVIFSIGNFVFNSKGRYEKLGAPPFSAVARLTIAPISDSWEAVLRLYPIVSDNVLTNYTPRPVTADEAEEVFTTLRARSGEPASFSKHYSLGHDDLGWNIVQRTKLSPRFLPPNADQQDDQKAGHTVIAPAGASVNHTSAPPASERATRPRRIKPDPDRYGEGSSQELLAQALRAREIAYEKTELTVRGTIRPAIRFTINGTVYFMSAARLYVQRDDGTRRRPDAEAAAIVKRKDVVSSILRARGYSAPEGVVFNAGERVNALRYFRSLVGSYPHGICVKPVDGGLGRHVYVGITDESRFAQSFSAAAEKYRRILVEEALVGEVHRFMWVGGRISAVRMGKPMNVVGDGVSSIKALVDAKNKERSANPSLRSYPLELGETQRLLLAKQEYTEESVLPTGKTLYLSGCSNRHAGADIIDTTDLVHPSYKEIVAAAVGAIPSMLVCGADVIITDHLAPATSDNYSIIELNTGPGFAGHHYPSIGQPRDVASDIVDHLLTL